MSDFASCSEALEGHFDKQLAKLPAALRKRVQADCPMPWDTMSPEQRRNMASLWDYQHDSAVGEKLQSVLSRYGISEPVQLTGKDVVKYLAALLKKITEVLNNPALTEDNRNSQLEELRLKHQDLEEQLARGDYLELDSSENHIKPPGHLDHDHAMQIRANQIANQHIATTKRPITKSKVANILAKELGMDASTVERRLRKDWK